MSESKPAASNGGFLGTVERVGNKLPDPAVLFIALLFIVWVLSWLLSYVTFNVFHPATGERIVIVNQLAGENFVQFLATMVNRFMTFGPVGVVLVAMLGIGVAEHTGFINTAIRALLNVTPKWLLTPTVILVGIVSHSAAEAGGQLHLEEFALKTVQSGNHRSSTPNRSTLARRAVTPQASMNQGGQFPIEQVELRLSGTADDDLAVTKFVNRIRKFDVFDTVVLHSSEATTQGGPREFSVGCQYER